MRWQLRKACDGALIYYDAGSSKSYSVMNNGSVHISKPLWVSLLLLDINTCAEGTYFEDP